jgi:hypothetical protein
MGDALFAGHNAWQVEVWRGGHNWHGRYRAGIKVSRWDIPRAAREVERWAGHPYFVSVQLT